MNDLHRKSTSDLLLNFHCILNIYSNNTSQVILTRIAHHNFKYNLRSIAENRDFEALASRMTSHDIRNIDNLYIFLFFSLFKCSSRHEIHNLSTIQHWYNMVYITISLIRITYELVNFSQVSTIIMRKHDISITMINYFNLIIN